MLDHLRYYFNILVVLAGVAGMILGGQYVWIGSLGVLFFISLSDALFGEDLAERKVKYPWIADFALYLHLPMLVLLYAVFAWRISQGFSEPNTFLTVVAYAGAIFSFGFLSAVPTLPIAHEFMHRRALFPRMVASILGTFYGDPNRDLAHVYTHHIHVGTPKDSDTARRGENVFSFMLRSTWGSYKDAFEIEKERQKKKGRSVWSWRSRIPRMYVMLALLIGITYFIYGWQVTLCVAGSMFLGKLLVEGPNYVQHYGLVRAEGTPFDHRHTWEHSTVFSRMVAVEITTHGNHHLDSYAPLYELKPSSADNKMPSIFTCFLLANVPPLWFRLVKSKLKKWDLHYATQEERILARKANERAGWPNWFDDNDEKPVNIKTVGL